MPWEWGLGFQLMVLGNTNIQSTANLLSSQQSRFLRVCTISLGGRATPQSGTGAYKAAQSGAGGAPH